jgi:hypothetical protein
MLGLINDVHKKRRLSLLSAQDQDASIVLPQNRDSLIPASGNFLASTIFESLTDAPSGWEDEMNISARFTDAESEVVGGRIGILLGLFVFAATYLYGIHQFGLMLGIAIGWLPCGLLGWAAALAGDAVATSLLHSSSMRFLSSSGHRD